MSRTSLSVAGVALVLLGFAGCGASERRFAEATGGKSGAAQGGDSAGSAGDTHGGRGGTAGLEAEAGEGGNGAEAGFGGEAGAVDNGAGGMAGETGGDSMLAIAQPSLAAGKTYVPFKGMISASGGDRYAWSLSKGPLPAGLSLQGAQSASVTIAGTPSEAGQFPITLSVSDGSTTKSVDVTLVITHTALFLSDRNAATVNELFITEIGGDTAPAPVRLSASFPSGGGVTSYAWSPDGSKVLYLAILPSTGVTELWVASLAAPGTAQRVSASGVGIGQFAFLGAGNIVAYSTATGDTYLTDLAMSPSPGKLVVTGKGGAATLRPSPNGTSVGIQLPGTNANDVSYATWAGGTPTATPLITVQGSGPYFSYDGRYSVITSGPSGSWFDHAQPGPTMGNPLSSSNGVNFAWHPTTQSLFLSTGSGASYDLSRGDFTSSGMTKTPLVSGNSCYSSQLRWSPDGKNGLYVCANDLRGINNLPSAVAGSDFSLLPSGFLSNSFTDTPASGWSPDSKWVALRADRDANSQYDLQLIRWAAPGVAYKPYATSVSTGVTTWAFAQNSQKIAFVGTVSPYANAALYVSKLPATGAPPTAVLVSAPASAVVQADINWLPGSRVLAYRAVVSGGDQLFAVSVAADGTAGSVVPVSGPSGSAVKSYLLAPTR